MQADLASDEAITRMADAGRKALGIVDVLVNNAGVLTTPVPPLETSIDDFDLIWAVNVRAPWLVTKNLAPHMARDGSVINVTSGLARGPSSDCFPYSLSKWAVEGLTSVLAAQIPQRVNAVDPGLVATKMSGFAGKPASDVTDVFVLLASDASRDVRGKTLKWHDYARRTPS